MRRRAGFTLIETLMALAIVSVLSLIAYPRVSSSMTKSNLRGARTQVANMLAAARVTATQGNRSTWVIFNGNVARIEAFPRRTVGGSGTRDTVGTLVNLSTVYGATASLSGGNTQVAYDPRGLATGILNSPLKISLTKNGYTDSVVVDMLGRVRK
ncbi:MAG TPA: prepilin-type N-terminal cleavage/methylation domain-containing protein [Gemmatimonadales bacterium]|nr:prepilin-type N-terminal cleavage/methylation domain-containing protein [Gemmatimonadales bacterium]